MIFVVSSMAYVLTLVFEVKREVLCLPKDLVHKENKNLLLSVEKNDKMAEKVCFVSCRKRRGRDVTRLPSPCFSFPSTESTPGGQILGQLERLGNHSRYLQLSNSFTRMCQETFQLDNSKCIILKKPNFKFINTCNLLILITSCTGLNKSVQTKVMSFFVLSEDVVCKG